MLSLIRNVCIILTFISYGLILRGLTMWSCGVTLLQRTSCVYLHLTARKIDIQSINSSLDVPMLELI